MERAKPSIEFDSEEKCDYAKKLLVEAGFVTCQTCKETFIASLVDGKPPICGKCGERAQQACQRRRVELKKMRSRVRELEAALKNG